MRKIFYKNLQEEYNLKFIYTWLSLIEEIDYMLYIRLLNVFKSVQNLYVISKNKMKFSNVLIHNNIILSQNLIYNLTNFNLKEKSFKIYNNLIKQNINIVTIEDTNFPKHKFLNMYNLPICLFLYGNINKLHEKVIYLHNENFNEYGNDVYIMFNEYINEKKWNNIIKVNNLRKSNNYIDNNYINNICSEKNNNIYILNVDIFNDEFKMYDIEKQHLIEINDSNLYIFIPNKFKEEFSKDMYITEIIVAISNICIIPQAKYDKNMYVKNIVELFIEQSKNVLVVPGNIYCKYSYFSNYLIKEGAEIILNKHDIDKYV